MKSSSKKFLPEKFLPKINQEKWASASGAGQVARLVFVSEVTIDQGAAGAFIRARNTLRQASVTSLPNSTVPWRREGEEATPVSTLTTCTYLHKQ